MRKKLLVLFMIFYFFSFSSFSQETVLEDELNSNYLTVKLEESKKSNLEVCLDYFTDFLGPIIALLGILLAVPILRKKLLENHISKALIDIQTANKEILLQTTDIIDEFVKRTYSNDLLSKNELEEIYDKIRSLYKKSQEGNSDSQTILFLLKVTIQNILKHYDPTKTSIISTREIYGIVLYCLDYVTFFSTQVVQIPKSTKTNKNDLINKKLKRYVSNSEFLKYKHFKQGLIDDPNSAHYLLFYAKIYNSSTYLIQRSAFQIFWNSSAIKKMLFVSGIYAPITLSAPTINPLFPGENYTLYLIGFQKRTLLESGKGMKYIINLIYSNPNDVERFVEGLSFEKLKENFMDTFIENSGFLISKANSMTKGDIEILSFQYDLEYVENTFKINKRRFQKKLK